MILVCEFIKWALGELRVASLQQKATPEMTDWLLSCASLFAI